MVRLRINHGVRPDDLQRDGYRKNDSGFYVKQIGPFEVSMKLSFPHNLRIKDWDDNRTPWILLKFLKNYEAGLDYGGEIKVQDDGKYKTLGTTETLNLITELNKWSDVKNRLLFWLDQVDKGRIAI